MFSYEQTIPEAFDQGDLGTLPEFRVIRAIIRQESEKRGKKKK